MGRIALIAVLALFVVPAGAQAAFPGQNGRIAYTFGGDIYSVNPDGSGVLQLTSDPAGDASPAWSSDGAQIVFLSGRDGNSEVYVMNGDGSAQQRVTDTTAHESGPRWSPEGERIVFERGGDIWTMDAGGGGETQLTSTSHPDRDPAWSPDGTQIVFSRSYGPSPPSGHIASDLHVIDSGGGTEEPRISGADYCSSSAVSPDWLPNGEHVVYAVDGDDDGDSCSVIAVADIACNSPNCLGDILYDSGFNGAYSPVASPDGQKILFVSYPEFGPEIFLADSNGNHESTPALGDQPDWQPLPVNTPSTYARPKGATPIHAPLVPAYTTCTTPNRVHGGGLSFGSCAPPNHRSPTLTVGVGDGSPAFSRSVGAVRLRALPGVPGGADDADMSISLSLTNVMRKADLSDYTGELGLDLSLQLTDHEGAVSQTTQKLPLSATVPCTATASTIDGATCLVDTTAEALIPNAITEGARAIFELGPIRVRDGGPDEDADTPAGDGVLATQGVFVP